MYSGDVIGDMLDRCIEARIRRIQIRDEQQPFDVSSCLIGGECLDVIVVEQFERNADLVEDELVI